MTAHTCCCLKWPGTICSENNVTNLPAVSCMSVLLFFVAIVVVVVVVLLLRSMCQVVCIYLFFMNTLCMCI